jgi:hypothetical protein
MVLIDHGFDAGQRAISALDNRNAATAGADHCYPGQPTGRTALSKHKCDYNNRLERQRFGEPSYP